MRLIFSLCLSLFIFLQPAHAEQATYKPFPTGMKFQYGKPGKISRLEIIYSHKDFVLFKHKYEDRKAEYFIEYKGLITIYCDSVPKSLIEDISIADKFWPLRLGNTMSGGSVHLSVTKKFIKNQHVPNGEHLLVITKKQNGIQDTSSYYWPKHRFVMIIWEDDTEVIEFPTKPKENSEIPKICKKNIPAAFWKKVQIEFP